MNDLSKTSKDKSATIVITISVFMILILGGVGFFFTKNAIQLLRVGQDFINPAMTYNYSGRYDDAITLLEKGIALHPDNVSLICHLGAVYIDKWYNNPTMPQNIGNDLLKEAEKYLERGAQLDSKSIYCQANYAVAFSDDSSKSSSQVWLEVKKAENLGWVFDQKFLSGLQAISPKP